MAQIFISHSSSDNAAALAIAGWLEAEGWDDLFLDIDPQRGLLAGERWERALHEAAQRCQAVLFLVSRAWLASDWCQRELHLAHRLDKHIFGVTIEEVDLASVPPKLKDHHQLVDLSGGRDHGAMIAVTLPDGAERHISFSRSGLSRLKAGLLKAEIGAQFFAWPPAQDPDRPPYRGMRPLEFEDAGILYGREAQIIAALDRLRKLREAAPPRLMPILGASGAGKSSFLRAGLLPRLARDDRNFLPLPVLRPDRAVLTGPSGLISALSTALARAGMRESQARIGAAIEAGADATAELLARLAVQVEPDALPPLLVLPVDQGEELFQAAGAAESRAFLRLLAGLLARDTPRLVVVITIRSDAWERLQTAPELEGMAQSVFSLPPQPRGSYKTVIEGPAERLRNSHRPLRIDPALTDRLLRDIEEGGAKDALPLLAFTLERLYLRHGGDGDLTLPEYVEMGGISGSITAAVERALRAADDDPAVPRSHEARLALLRRALIPWLAGIDPDTGLPRRQIARMAEIPEEARPLVRHLIEERLLSTDRQPGMAEGEVTVEPAHEALLRQWGLLLGWLEEDRARLAALEGVKRATRDWEANARDPAWLSHQGERLEDAEALLSRPDLAQRLDAADLAYLAAARAEITARSARELEDARRLAEARGQVARRTRIGLVVAVLLALVAGGFGLFALERANSAQTAAAAADAAARDADTARQTAQERLTQAQISESRYLTTAARRASAAGDRDLALALIPEALPFELSDTAADTANSPLKRSKEEFLGKLGILPERPLLPEALAELLRQMDLDQRKVMLGHRNADTTDIQFSDDGKRILLRWRGTATVWDAEAGTLLRTVSGERDIAGIDDILTPHDLSPDGETILTTSGSKAITIKLMAVADGTISEDLVQRDEETPFGAVFLPGNLGYYLTRGKSIRLSLTRTGEVFWFPAAGRVLQSFKASPWAALALVGYEQGAPEILDLSSGVTRRLQLDPYILETIAAQGFTPEGQIRLMGTGGKISLVNPDGTDAGQSTSVELMGGGVAFSNDAALVIAADFLEPAVTLWDAVTGEEKWRYRAEDFDRVSSPFAVSSYEFSQDGSALALMVSFIGRKTLYILDIASGQLRASFPNAVRAAFSPDPGLILIDDGQKMTLEALPGEARYPYAEGSAFGVPQELLLAPDGGALWLRTRTSKDFIWNTRTGTISGLNPGISEIPVFSPDGQWLISSDRIQIHPVTDQDVPVIPRHPGAYTLLEISPDSTFVATSMEDFQISIRDIESGEVYSILQGLEGYTETASFSADTRLFAGATISGEVAIWPLEPGSGISAISQRDLHSGWVNSLVFSGDGRFLVSASKDWTAAISPADGKGEPVILRGHEGSVNSAVFSPDGQTVATASEDGTARIWSAHDVATPPLVLRGHGAGLRQVGFSADGAMVVTAAADGTVRVWHSDNGDIAAVFAAQEGIIGPTSLALQGDRLTVALPDGRVRVADLSAPDLRLRPADLIALGRARQFLPLREDERKMHNLAPLVPEQPDAESAIQLCDRLAADHLENPGQRRGIAFRQMDPRAAIPACSSAIADSPELARLPYQLARAQESAGKPDLAAVSYRQAADLGHALAMAALARLYRDGEGVGQDPALALELFREADERGAIGAAADLGMMLWNGIGTPKDREAAMALWSRTAREGDPFSHERLASFVPSGHEGAPPDPEKALWHLSAALRLRDGLGLESPEQSRLRANLARRLDPVTVARIWREAGDPGRMP